MRKIYVFLLLVHILMSFSSHLISQRETYDDWKEGKQKEWQQNDKITLAARIDSLASDTIELLRRVEEDPQNTDAQEALYEYNFLRELIGLTTVKSLSETDNDWLNEIKKEASSHVWMEEFQYTYPTILQMHLVKKALDLLKIKDEMRAFSFGGVGGLSGLIEPEKYSITLCNTPDIDQQIATIYHELGHIVHRDNENDIAINAGQKTYEEMLQDSSFKEDVERVDRLLEPGKKAFDVTTPIGKRVQQVLSEYTHFWRPPGTMQELQKTLYWRGKEKRADLFLVERLFEQKQLDVILQEIVRYAFGSSPAPVVAQSLAYHPSDMERALYMAGFLVEKGIDINKAFREWYAQGSCKAVPRLIEMLSSLPAKSNGARDFTKALKLWKEETGYQAWKEAEEKQWLKKVMALWTAKVDSLVWKGSYWLDLVKKSPEDSYAQTEALYAYNLLRELLYLPTVKSFSEIDHDWFVQIKEEAKSYVYREQFQYASPTALQEYLVKKAQDLLKFKDELRAFSFTGTGGFAGLIEPGKYGIVLCNTPDIDELLATIYHNLGYIVHRDNENDVAISAGQTTYDEILNDSSFKEEIERIDSYLELGKKAFNKSTPIGKHITDILSRYPMLQFWTPPEDPGELQKMLYQRGKQKRADLFKIQELFKQQQLSPILLDITKFAFGWSVTPVIAGSLDYYPSDMERALYMTGFLVDKGVDVNKAFSEWYARGACKVAPKDLLDMPFSTPPKTRGALDFSRAYERWQEAQVAHY